MHANSLSLFRRHGLPHFKAGMEVLEIGPDPDWLCRDMLPAGVEYYHADAQNVRLDAPGAIRMNGEYAIDAWTARVDVGLAVVFACNVIEHVKKHWRWVVELARVTKPGGVLVFVSPVSWPFHEAPVDCWRIYPDGYKALFDEAGLEHVESWSGNVAPIDEKWRGEHGDRSPIDTVAVARKPV
jgi:SAM-dependent methyltransferase